MLQLGASTVIFLFAASMAKSWALAPNMWRLALVLALYTVGNLIMLRLIRDFGMGVALSLSAIIQLVAVNLVAFAWFGVVAPMNAILAQWEPGPIPDNFEAVRNQWETGHIAITVIKTIGLSCAIACVLSLVPRRAVAG